MWLFIIIQKEIGKVYTSPIEVITEIGFQFHSPKCFNFIHFYFFNIFIMFTLHYFIIIQDARNVGLRICSSFSELMKVSLEQEPNKRTRHTTCRRENPLTYTGQERKREFGTLVCLSWYVKQENKRRTSFGYTSHILHIISLICQEFILTFPEKYM